MKNLIFTLLSITIVYQTYAQKPRKFGAITKEEMNMLFYEKDTTAKAVKIYERGSTDVGYRTGSFYITLRVHEIIKIFEDDEFRRGDISIQYPDGSTVQKLKAVTYNLVKGKTVESILSKADIHDEKLIDGIRVKKFSMPDLAPGSIVEYTYTINSGNLFSLNSWYFQSTIPIIWSEYQIRYPNWFKYQTIAQGYLTFDINSRKDTYFSINQESVPGIIQKFAIKDAPAFKSEKYITTINNYLSKIDFELSAIQIPQTENTRRYVEIFYSDFEKIRKTLIEDQNFGKKLNSSRFLAEEISIIKTISKNEKEELTGLYNLIRDHTNWNERYALFSNKSANKIYEGDKCNSAEINLLLVAVLREAGYKADPIILSTRNNGIVHPIYPLINKYNHVICQVSTDEASYLLDATDNYMPFGMIPEDDLNGNGRLISENKTAWVSLKTPRVHEIAISGEFDLSTEGILEGKMATTFSGYAALNLRHQLEEEGMDRYRESVESTEGWAIEDWSIEDIDQTDSPIHQELMVALENNAEGLGQVIYLDPILLEKIEENPFKLDKRMYPVDYAYPRRTTLTFTYKIPEGYRLETKPADLSINLPGKGGKYRYSVQLDRNILRVESTFEISKMIFLPKEYKFLQAFYDQVWDKQAEQIVLIKSTD
jgi:Domain of Unknown Function with PDB structure (DUF3857)